MIDTSPIAKAKQKLRTSPTFKLIAIGIIILILLIPTSMITSIIHEREMMSDSAIREVSSKWAQTQDITGPILTLPYTKQYLIDEKKHYSNHLFHILPKRLNINADVDPRQLKRGIYDIVVYNSKLKIDGTFGMSEINKLTEAHEIKWSEAYITMGIADLRGIKNQLELTWDQEQLQVDPGSRITQIIGSGVTITTPIEKSDIDRNIPFAMDINLNGSKNLSFVPVGGITSVNISSPWTTPSFNGLILPDSREVTSEGFTANWQTLELNRNYPNSWKDNSVTNKLLESRFGVDLLMPIDDYQKSMRSAKYAILILSLTFLIFFLVEIMNHRKIHPFQYTLVGLALSLFYILLVSISEHSNFNMAYLVSSIAIVLMIGLYSLSVFNNKKLSMVLVLILSGLYGFLFVTLQLVDYALLMGGIGLAVILSTTMYFTRKIDWYNVGEKATNIAAK